MKIFGGTVRPPTPEPTKRNSRTSALEPEPPEKVSLTPSYARLCGGTVAGTLIVFQPLSKATPASAGKSDHTPACFTESCTCPAIGAERYSDTASICVGRRNANSTEGATASIGWSDGYGCHPVARSP